LVRDTLAGADIRFAQVVDSSLEEAGFDASVPPGSPSVIPGLQAKTPLRGNVARIGRAETWYQGPAAIRCITESRGGVRKVW
jgi:hypothetical protein